MHAIEPERLLSDRTWTQWKAAAGLAPAPADPDLAVLGAAVSRACQITAPGYLNRINGLPASGLGLAGEDAAAANMLYSREAWPRARRPSGGWPLIPASWPTCARWPATSWTLPCAPAISRTPCPWNCTAPIPTTRSRPPSAGSLLRFFGHHFV